MNAFFKYFIGLDHLNCHAKFHGNMLSRSRQNDVGNCCFWLFSVYFWTEIMIVTFALSYGDEDVTLNGCLSCRVMIPVLFVNVKRHRFGSHFQLHPYYSLNEIIIMKLIPQHIAIYHLLYTCSWLEAPMGSTLVVTSHVPYNFINKHYSAFFSC